MIDIPVLSELVKFTHPKELCQLSCASKTLHIDLQGTKAWARLAEAQLPPPTPRDDSEARSHVWRREVAKALPHPRREGFAAPATRPRGRDAAGSSIAGDAGAVRVHSK